MCKQKTVLEVIKQTKDLPEWFVMHAEAQAEDYEAAIKRDKETMERVAALDKRMIVVESKLDSVVSTQVSMQAQLTEIYQLIKNNNMKEKAWAFDGVAKFFSSRAFKVACLLALGFLVGAGKDVVMAAFGLL